MIAVNTSWPNPAPLATGKIPPGKGCADISTIPPSEGRDLYNALISSVFLLNKSYIYPSISRKIISILSRKKKETKN